MAMKVEKRLTMLVEPLEAKTETLRPYVGPAR